MKLYFAPVSPFVRMVRVLLHETGQQDDVTLVQVAGHPTAPGTLPLDQNPLGKIPVLETPEGVLYDSRVILRYVSDRAGGAGYPAPPALWPVLTREAMGQGMAEAAVLVVYEGRLRADGLRSEPWMSAQWARVIRACDALEAAADDLTQPFEGCPDMGRIAVAVALGYFDYRLPDRAWREGHPRLAAWYQGFAQRPSMLATVPKDPV